VSAVLAQPDFRAVRSLYDRPPPQHGFRTCIRLAEQGVKPSVPGELVVPRSTASSGAPLTSPSSLQLRTVTEKWQRVSGRMQADLDVLAACASDGSVCSPVSSRFLAIVEAGRERQGRARLGTVNRAINLSIQITSDITQHGVPDLWSSPLETFMSGKGDCEDYAIAKFTALLLAGVPDEDLRILIVDNARTRQVHAVVAARTDGRWLILDNRRLMLVKRRDLLLRRAHVSCRWQGSARVSSCTWSQH
jgi:predicted transglutaminase-like cysteine proteinase